MISPSPIAAVSPIRALVTAICTMLLVGLVYWSSSDLEYSYLYLKWVVWHELITGCHSNSEFQRSADIVAEIKPIGLSRLQCAAIFGIPDPHHMDTVDYGDGLWWDYEHDRWWDYKHDRWWDLNPLAHPYHFALLFKHDKCVAAQLETPMCCAMLDPEYQLFEKIRQQKFLSVHCSQSNSAR